MERYRRNGGREGQKEQEREDEKEEEDGQEDEEVGMSYLPWSWAGRPGAWGLYSLQFPHRVLSSSSCDVWGLPPASRMRLWLPSGVLP